MKPSEPADSEILTSTSAKPRKPNHRMRKPEPALEAFEKAAEADPNDGHTRRNLGGMPVMSERYGEADAHLRKALALVPDDPQTIFGLATALESIGTDAADQEADDLYGKASGKGTNYSVLAGLLNTCVECQSRKLGSGMYSRLCGMISPAPW